MLQFVNGHVVASGKRIFSCFGKVWLNTLLSLHALIWSISQISIIFPWSLKQLDVSFLRIVQLLFTLPLTFLPFPAVSYFFINLCHIYLFDYFLLLHVHVFSEGRRPHRWRCHFLWGLITIIINIIIIIAIIILLLLLTKSPIFYHHVIMAITLNCNLLAWAYAQTRELVHQQIIEKKKKKKKQNKSVCSARLNHHVFFTLSLLYPARLMGVWSRRMAIVSPNGQSFLQY